MPHFYLRSGCSWIIAISALWLLWSSPHGSQLQAEDKSKKERPLLAGSKAAEVWDGNGLKMKFCWCPAGKFTLGSPKDEKGRFDDEDQVSVTISRGFWLGKCELTQGEWGKIMATTLREQRDKADPKYELVGEGANYPMYFVSHDEATEFCMKLTDQERKAGRLPADWEYRLPTEAQWEYACRAGTTTATAYGDKLSSDKANFNGGHPYNGADEGKYLDRTTTVGSYKANAWGLHDMHGNASEWCRDCYGEKHRGGIDPEVTERAFTRVIRGSCWSNYGLYCRSAYRYSYSRGDRFNMLGFRIALIQLAAGR